MKWLPFIFLLGCAQVTSLGLKKHEFGLQPTKIIWFQVAGLEEEQLAMLRFQQPAERRTSFEKNICIGKSWSYNLFELRAPAEATFLSQLTGKKNVKLNCEDASLRPVWSYLSGHGYQTGVLESPVNARESILAMNQCGVEGAEFLKGIYLWSRQRPPVGESTYHTSESVVPQVNVPHFDRSCTGKECSVGINDSFRTLYQAFSKVGQKHLFIVRDFSYLDAIKKKDMLKARQILAQLESAYEEALSFSEKSNDYLILLTTGDSRYVQMPAKGKEWFEFEKKGLHAQVKRRKLANLVLANGSRAENFCGIYEDSEVFERLLSGPKQQGLELKMINPFK